MEVAQCLSGNGALALRLKLTGPRGRRCGFEIDLDDLPGGVTTWKNTDSSSGGGGTWNSVSS